MSNWDTIYQIGNAFVCSSICNNGMWECTENSCPVTCLFSPGNMFRTFDSTYYFYSGSCDYVMAQTISGYDPESTTPSFTVWLDKETCEASHHELCDVSVSLRINDGDIYE